MGRDKSGEADEAYVTSGLTTCHDVSQRLVYESDNRTKKKYGEGFPKAGELIEFRSQHELTLQDRRILNLLIENAGPHIASTIKHRISVMALRGSHKGGERVRNSIDRLMQAIVEVPTRDSKGNRATQKGVLE